MKTLHLSIIAVLVLGIGTAYAYSSAGIPETHYPPTNDTKLELLVMNSTEFKERTTGYNYTLAGIDNNWIPKASNYYDFGGARVTFMVWGFDNGTVKGVAFNLDPQLKIKSIFEYNGDNPPAGYYTDRCSGCFLGVFNSTKQLVEPKNVLESPLKQFKSGIAANDVKCKQDLQLIIKAEDETPTCVKLQTAQKLVERGWGWAMQTIDSLKPLLPNRIIGLENDTGIVTLGNQTYYFETPNYTNTAYYNPVQISFHEMIFTLFPPGFRGGLPTGVGCEGTTTGIITGSGSYYWTDAKFPDGIHELLHIFGYSRSSCPVYSIPTYFSTHANPQAGLTFYDGKMKLLVNAENKSNLSKECDIKFTPKPFEFKVFPNGTSLTVNYVPVFLMKQNSTGKICTNNWRTIPEMNYSGKVTTGIGKDDSTTQDVTVASSPDTITIDNTNKTIMYTITASKNSSGFYRFSPMFSNCGGIPIAIGYDSTHSFDNDFPWLGETVPCPLPVANTEITGLTGIDVAYITKEYR